MRKLKINAKRLLVYLLTLAMLFTLMPAAAFADEEQETVNEVLPLEESKAEPAAEDIIEENAQQLENSEEEQTDAVPAVRAAEEEESWIVIYHANSAVNPYAYYDGYYDLTTGEWVDRISDTHTVTNTGGSYIDRWSCEPINDSEDWTFSGWSVDPNAKTPDDEILVDADMDVYAVWQSNFVSVTFDANGGYLLDDNGKEVSSKTISCDRGDRFEVPYPVYNKDPQTMFEGWYTERSGGAQISSWEQRAQEDAIYYAHWKELQITPLVLDESTPVSSSGEKIFFSFTPEEDGFYRLTFSEEEYYGYLVELYDARLHGEFETLIYTDGSVDRELKAGETVYYSISNEYEGDSFACRIQLTQLETVTVTYHTTLEDTCFVVDGEEVSSVSRPNAKDSELRSSVIPVSESGAYEFVGWARRPDATEPDYIWVEKDMDVYAVWRHVYTVTYHVNAEEAYFDIDYTYDDDGNETVVLIREETERIPEGEKIWDYKQCYPYNGDPSVKFAGWAAEPDTSVVDPELRATKNMDVYAVWNEPCTVTLDLNIDPEIAFFYRNEEEGDETPVSSKDLILAEGSPITQIILHPEITDPDYYFCGWSADKNATKADPFLVAAEGLTVYAVWHYPYTKVTFDANGGYFYDDDREITQVQETFYKDTWFSGHQVYHENKFAYMAGWFDAKEGGKRYIYDTPIQEDVTLYAHWNIREPDELELEEGTVTIATEGETLHSFVPDETGLYRIYTYDRGTYINPKLTLYDSDMDYLTDNTGGRGGVNAAINITMQAGRTYYIGTSLETEDELEFSYGVIIKKIDTAKVTYHLNRSTDEAYFNGEDGSPTDIFSRDEEKGWLSIRNGYNTSYWYVSPVVAEKTLYFAGWSTDPAAEEVDPDFTGLEITQDTDLYAVWKTAYPVKLNANRDISEAYFSDYDDGYKETTEKTIYLPNGPAPSGYQHMPMVRQSDYESPISFAGWSVNPNAAEPDKDLKITGPVTLYAVWTERQKVTVHTGYKGAYFTWGSSGTKPDSMDFYFTPGDQISSSWYICRDYVVNPDSSVLFAGFATAPNDTAAQDYLNITEGITDIYMVWYPSYTVTFNANKAKNPDAYYREFDFISGEYLKAETCEETYLKGSELYPEGNQLNVHSSLRNESRSLALAGFSVNPNAAEPDDMIILEGDITLYAVWKPASTVRFHANDKDAYLTWYDKDTGMIQQDSVMPRTYLEGTYFESWQIPSPSRTGSDKKFVGWAEDPKATEGKTIFKVNGDMDLYAVWTTAYPITLHANHPTAYFSDFEGIEEETDTYHTYGYGYDYDSNLPNQKNSRYDWIGISDDPNAAGPNREYYVTGPVDLYYIWREQANITFDANGGYFATQNTTQLVSGWDGEPIQFSIPVYHNDPTLHLEGWYTEKEGGINIAEGVAAKDGMRIYAHWSNALEGQCGSDAYWKLVETPSGSGKYTLKITGSGRMYDYTGSIAQMVLSSAPWFAYEESITAVELADGITTIGDFAFTYLENVKSMVIPESVYLIGGYSFAVCRSLESITIPANVNYLAEYAFLACSALKEITFEGHAPEIYDQAFGAVKATAYYPGDEPSWTRDVMRQYGGEITWAIKGAEAKAPEFTKTAMSTAGLELTWSSVPGASRYQLDKKTGSKWTTISNGLTGTSHTDATLASSDKASYRVRAYAGNKWTGYSAEKEVVFNPFSDVPSTGKTFEYVSWAFNNGIVTGTSDTTFTPNNPCSRVQFVMMLWKMMGSTVVDGVKNPFSDISGSKTIKAITWALDEGIINAADKFNPNDSISRVQIVMMLWKMAGSPSVSTEGFPFTDVTGNKTKKAVMWAYNTGITKGTSSTTFAPDNDCTRLQLVIFLYKFNNL